MENKPCYITNYRRLNINDTVQSDEELTEEMLFAFSLADNVKLFDIRGDLFDPSFDEITYNEKAILKQIELANEVHRLGGEVLMSSHPLRFLPYDDVLKIAKAQQERNVDIVKIVTLAESHEELVSNFETSIRLNRDLDKQFLFLCGGSHCRNHRLLAPLITNSLFLSVQRGIDGGPQPQMDDAKKVIELSQ
jgi:3-dehydroquinate dehydratase